MKVVIGLLIGIIMTNISLGGEDDEDPFQLKDEFAIEQQAYNDDQTQKITQGNNEELKKEYINDENQFYLGNYIKKDIDQYIVCYTIRSKEMLLEHLNVLGKLHTNKAKTVGEKPVVFQGMIILIKERDSFSIEKYVVDDTIDSFKEFKTHYDRVKKFGKPIVFERVSPRIKNDVENYYKDVKVLTWYQRWDEGTYEEYSNLIASGVENIFFEKIRINSESISEEEFKKQLYTVIRDKRILSVWVSGPKPTPIEYVSCIKVTVTPLIDPQNVEDVLFFPVCNSMGLTYVKNVTCNTFICTRLIKEEQNFTCPIMVYAMLPNESQRKIEEHKDRFEKRGVKTLYISKDYLFNESLPEYFQDFNVDKKIFNSRDYWNLWCEYYHYVEDNDIVYLSGYVNVKNKPDELSDKEWDQVLILKQKVKEMLEKIMNSSEPFD